MSFLRNFFKPKEPMPVICRTQSIWAEVTGATSARSACASKTWPSPIPTSSRTMSKRCAWASTPNAPYIRLTVFKIMGHK